jgi:hypothetical protein
MKELKINLPTNNVQDNPPPPWQTTRLNRFQADNFKTIRRRCAAVEVAIRAKFEELWSTCTPTALQPGKWQSLFNENRRTETILARIRIGHTKLTHLPLMEGKPSPSCSTCGNRPITIEHILLSCPAYAEQRHRHFQSDTLASILGDQSEVEDIVLFLKDSNLYDLI